MKTETEKESNSHNPIQIHRGLSNTLSNPIYKNWSTKKIFGESVFSKRGKGKDNSLVRFDVRGKDLPRKQDSTNLRKRKGTQMMCFYRTIRGAQRLWHIMV